MSVLDWIAGLVAPRRPRQAVLAILASGEELHGLTIVERSNGLLSRGAVYVLLDRMEDEGLIESRLEPLDTVEALVSIRRRLYRLKPPPRRGAS